MDIRNGAVRCGVHLAVELSVIVVAGMAIKIGLSPLVFTPPSYLAKDLRPNVSADPMIREQQVCREEAFGKPRTARH